MSNLFSDFFKEFASPFMVQELGERDQHGDLATVTYHPPGNGDPVALVGVIVGTMQVDDEVSDEHGTHLRDQIEDIVTLTIPANQDAGDFAPKVEGKLEVPSLPGEKFTVIDVLDGNSPMRSVRVSRKHITKIRKAASQRA